MPIPVTSFGPQPKDWRQPTKLNSVETYRQVIESVFIREPDEFKIDRVLRPVDV